LQSNMKRSVGIFLGALFLNLCYGLPADSDGEERQEPTQIPVDPEYPDFPDFSNSARTIGIPSFSVSTERSKDGIPEVTVTFPEHQSDIMLLNRFYLNEEDRIAGLERCNFVGKLASDPLSSIAMTGCVGSEDVEFTIFSKNVGSMYRWTKEGEVEEIENPLKKMSGLKPSEQRELEDGDYQNGDEIINKETQEKEFKIEENFSASGNWVSLPQQMTLHLRVGYDNTLLNRFGGSASQKIWDALTHTWATFQLSSLGTKINIHVHSWYHINTNLFASNYHLSKMYQTTRNYLQGAHLMLYVSNKGGGDTTGGIAYLSEVCNNSNRNHRKQSINEYQSSAVATGWLIAHELGHNLGMYHDFNLDTWNDNKKYCGQSQGLMSYGFFQAPYRYWSTCSQHNFKAHYQNMVNQNGYWCM